MKQTDVPELTRYFLPNMEKAILIGNDNVYREIGFKMPLKDVWQSHPDYFKQVLNEKLKHYAKDGYKLLNTNIPMQFLN